MNTQSRQLFTTKLGFYYAPELEAVDGAMDKFKECVEKADKLFDAMAKENPLACPVCAPCTAIR